MSVDRLNEINASDGDENTQKKLKKLGLGPGTIRPDYSFPDLSESEQQEDNVIEGLSNKGRKKEGFWGMGSVTGANLSGYPSQFDNDYYAQV
jgi:hypothetical protein